MSVQGLIDELRSPKSADVPLRQLLDQACLRVLLDTDVVLVGIWVLDQRESMLDLFASASNDAQLHSAHERVRVGNFKIGSIAAQQLPQLINDLPIDPRLTDREWVSRERLAGFAGCPLLIRNRTVGVIAVFSRSRLTQETVDVLLELAPVLALLIQQRSSAFQTSSDSATRRQANGDERFLFLGDAIPHQVWTAGPDGQLTYVNARVLQFFGRTHEHMIASGWLDMLHPDDVTEFTKRWGMALGTGEPYEFEFRLWSVHHNAYRWHESRALPQRNAKNEIAQWYGANTDVDARRRSEDRHRLLLEAGQRLSTSLDAPHILAEVAAICVPSLADWCFIDLKRLDGTTDRVQVAHANPLRADLAKRFFQWPAAVMSGTHPGHDTAQRGISRFIEVLTSEQLDAAAMNAEHRQAQREMAPSSFMSVPLRAIERTVGVMTLLTSVDSGRRLLAEDLPLVEEIGARAAMALENARYTSELRAAVAQRERALAEVEFERSSLKRIFEQAPGAICVTRGPKHVIDTVNPRFVALVGDRPLAGVMAEKAFHEVWAQGPFLEMLDQAFETRQPYIGQEVPVLLDKNRNGELVPGVYDFVFQPIVDEVESVQGLMIYAVEVTDQVGAKKDRETLIQTLAQTNAELDEFASVASHDLKAPLRGIVNLASWLSASLAPKANAEERSQLDLIQSRAKRLAALVDGILIYARAGRLRGQKDLVDTKALVQEIRELLGATREPQIEVSARLPTLKVERVLMQQVLMNLIGNAIKYTRRPDARIWVDCETVSDAWLFSVKDNGPGIAPEHQQKIWEPFQRLQGLDVVEGTGIGLSVVKKIVESRGGSVSIESASGQGANFIVRWPRSA